MSCALAQPASATTSPGAMATGSIPESIPLCAGTVELERHIGDHPWGWVVFPAGFEAPGILELARLQTWTLKPALLAA